MKRGSLSQGWLMMANGNLTLNTLPDACTVMPRSRTSRKVNILFMVFTLAITAQNPFYRPVSEKDSQEGYVNLFLHPLLDIYKDMSHSYIIELKYAKGKDSSERIEQLRRQAIEQAERYASSESVQKAISPTMLHKIIVVYRGMEMVVCEEL